LQSELLLERQQVAHQLRQVALQRLAVHLHRQAGAALARSLRQRSLNMRPRGHAAKQISVYQTENVDREAVHALALLLLGHAQQHVRTVQTL
jgi:hypothetical protein